MTTPSLPYFFDEAERASSAKQPGEREKALNLTKNDLNWLKRVYLATRAARTDKNDPMHVYRLLLDRAGKTGIPFAGAFAMSRPDDGEVTLYTPWKGLIKFADMADLKSKLKEWLAQPQEQLELLRYLSMEQRQTVLAAAAPDISTEEIQAAIFQDQALILEQNQAHNLQAMMAELVKLPSPQSMLDETLKNALFKPFPTLDQRLTRLKSFVGTVSAFDTSDYAHTMSSLSLSDALLQYYLTNQWPAGDSRVFSNPGLAVSSDADNQAWESAVKEIAQSFTPHLHSLLETFWNTPLSNGLSRSAFFAEGLRDTYHVNLLLQRQKEVLTTEDYQFLMNVSLASASNDTLRIEKVRVTAPLNHYAELACTLMIGSKDTLGYLYTQSRGIEATSDLAELKKIVLDMMQSEGHEDMLLNFMSLDEYGTFLSLEPNERMIVGEPIVSPVFEQLMTDVIGKQQRNLVFALSRYRESEGTLDPHALLDKALDVRGLIDDRLLAADAAGRWSTQADRRWHAQPATVRAETAKQQLAQLTTVQQALDQLREQHPAIPATTRTATEAQSIVASSLNDLQSSFTHTLSTALRSELNLHTVARTLGITEQAIIKTVLDTPVRLQRGALNGFLPDVFALSLKAGDSADVLKLASCFVLTERGGLDPEHSGKAIAWSPARGFEAFPSLTSLRAELKRRLEDFDERTTLLENLGHSERLPGLTYTLAPLQRIDEHFLDHVQKPFVQLDRASVTNALASALPTPILTRLLQWVALREPKTGLHRATEMALALTTQQKLPAWLAKAPIKDQILHAELLQQYLNNVSEGQDYLSGIRSLARTAHLELQKQLKADTFDLDPDKVQVQISSRRMSAASTQTLTEFALSHLQDLEAARFKLVSLDATVIPEEVDERYIKDLIRNLKLGEHQQTVLNEAFADTHAGSAVRKKRFYSQLPWQLMHYAHSEKLQERLSEAGFDLIRQVMDMPDAIARAAVDGAQAIIRPLEFIGFKKDQTIKVPGLYLINSTSDNTGPHILLAPYSPRHGLKEYENEQQLLTELETQGALHDWVLRNLPPPDRTLLQTRIATPDKDLGEVTLASTPLKGNLFAHLFKDNAALLARLLGCQSDEKSQSEWATIKHVVGEDLQAAFTFLTGKIAYPVTVWRSYRDIKQSAEDLQTHKWGAALKAFISGIAQLASLRQSMLPHALASSIVSKPAPETAIPRFKWQDVDITAPERTQLQRHEKTDLDLGSMTLNPTLGLYTDPTTKTLHGPIEGKVYPVEKRGNRWRIFGNKIRGPYVRQISSKQWILETENLDPRYGLLNRLETMLTADAGMSVEATGLREIRSLFPFRARMIDEGLDLATTYAWNSFRNLQLLKDPTLADTPAHTLIKAFLGVQTVVPRHVEQLEKVVTDIFSALLDPTLRHLKSNRFAVGDVLQDPTHTFAFTVPRDVERRIYLAERFFHPGFEYYREHLTDTAFPISVHARATTLIHELSHIACKAEDITYLDPGRPFADLINTSTTAGQSLKDALSELQATALSIKTPLTELFMSYAPDTRTWTDLGEVEETEKAKKRILALTDQYNLSGARDVFKKNPLIRLSVQLSNADSIAWLISHLGRQLHASNP